MTLSVLSLLKNSNFFYFPLLYTQCLFSSARVCVCMYVCVCVCVCVVERNVFLLCSVMPAVSVPSKNSLEKLNDFRHSGVL